MKNKLKITLIVLVIIVLGVLIVLRMNYTNKRMIATVKVKVVRVYDNSLLAINEERTDELYDIGFKSQGNIGFKPGQELLIHFDGVTLATYPGKLSGVSKIEIIKEESEVEIPKSILRYCYSSKEKVNITVNEISNTGITLSIVDTNELPYEYSSEYIINKWVKNENYTGVGQIVGEDTENSTHGYIRTRS